MAGVQSISHTRVTTMITRIFVLLVCIVLSSCTRLGVKVEIYNPLGITSDDAVEATVKREAANHSYLLQTKFYSDTAVDLKNQVSEFLSYLSSVQCPDKSTVIASGDLPRIIATASNNVENALGEVIKARNDGLLLLRQGEVTKKEARSQLLTDALAKFSAALKMLNDLSTNLEQSYDVSIKTLHACLNQTPTRPNLKTLNKVMTYKRETETSIDQKVALLMGGARLLDDPLAPIVIAAPDEFWKGVYNKTTALGTMGNTDIAIKMETAGTFTIKGLRVDASKVTEATFDVLKKSIRMVAAAYGVPLPASEKKSQQEHGGSPTDLLMSADEVRHSADRKRLLSRAAALTLFDLIVAGRSHLADATSRKAAIQNLKLSFKSYKGQLTGD
jgi:hypothetical protein